MKTISLALVLAGLGVCAVSGQEAPPAVQDVLVEENVAVAHPIAPEASVAFQAQMFRTVFGLEVEFEGAVAKANRLGNPFQLINPFAPVEAGDGFDNVTIDPETGQATGINLFGIRF